MRRFSNEIEEAVYKMGYKEGYQIGKVLALSGYVKDGYITLERAAELSEMSVEEFLQKAKEYKDEA